MRVRQPRGGEKTKSQYEEGRATFPPGVGVDPTLHHEQSTHRTLLLGPLGASILIPEFAGTWPRRITSAQYKRKNKLRTLGSGLSHCECTLRWSSRPLDVWRQPGSKRIRARSSKGFYRQIVSGMGKPALRRAVM